MNAVHSVLFADAVVGDEIPYGPTVVIEVVTFCEVVWSGEVGTNVSHLFPV